MQFQVTVIINKVIRYCEKGYVPPPIYNALNQALGALLTISERKLICCRMRQVDREMFDASIKLIGMEYRSVSTRDPRDSPIIEMLSLILQMNKSRCGTQCSCPVITDKYLNIFMERVIGIQHIYTTADLDAEQNCIREHFMSHGENNKTEVEIDGQEFMTNDQL